jgi:hypothetical protein
MIRYLPFVVWAFGTTLAAQWLGYPVAGIPRLPDGKPNLTAPAPKATDGKPDLSGVWRLNATVAGKALDNFAMHFDAGGFPIQPWADALVKARARDPGRGDPAIHCLPPGVARLYGHRTVVFFLKIVQTPSLIVMLYESDALFRQIFLDGRQLPKDPNPAWLGYSVGRWDGDALVVHSAGFNGKAWLDDTGLPATDALRLRERFRRLDFGHMEVQLTVDDPKAYTKPWTVTESLQLLPDTDLIEYVCNENERDAIHIDAK